VFVAITNENENNNIHDELANTKQELLTLQKNYTDQQQNFIEFMNSPILETKLGAKVLSSSATDDYLWVTGEVYNWGFGNAYNVTIEVKLFTSSSTKPIVNVLSLDEIDSHNFKTIRNAFYVNGRIKSWEINANCSAAK
jgi:hypothetical protein